MTKLKTGIIIGSVRACHARPVCLVGEGTQDSTSERRSDLVMVRLKRRRFGNLALAKPPLAALLVRGFPPNGRHIERRRGLGQIFDIEVEPTIIVAMNTLALTTATRATRRDLRWAGDQLTAPLFCITWHADSNHLATNIQAMFVAGALLPSA